MNSKYAYACAGLLLGLTACSNEDLTSPTEVVTGKTVNVTLTVDRSGGKTRTEVGENSDKLSLYSHWVAGDKLLVVNSANVKVGELEIELPISTEDPSKGVFKGEADIDASKTYTLVYLGGKNGEDGIPYAIWNNGTGIYNPVKTPDAEDGFSVSGALADLCRADLMKKDEVQFNVSGENAYPTDNVDLEAQNAMAHFTLTGIPADLGTGATLKVTYGDVAHAITGIQKELYLPMPTGKYTITFTLTNGTDSYTGKVKEGSEVEVDSQYYYVATDDATSTGKGIEVTLTNDEPEQPQEPVDDGTVGPTIQIGQKYYRFMRGNLYCDILEKDNYTWHLYDRETDYQLKAGTSSLYVTKTYTSYVRQINGTWKGSSNPSNVNATNHIIDMFPWGATGLGEGEYAAKLPDIIRKGVANENTGTSYNGEDWPSNNSATMDVNANANITNLWKGYSFNDKWIYDFGYAYMQTQAKLPNGDKRTFVTAPLAAYEFICNPDKAFYQGCVVKGANYDGTSDAKGALILYGITDIKDAEEAIKAVGGNTKSGFAKLTPNKPKSGFTYLIELPSYAALRALDKVTEVNGKEVKIQAIFFASGGNGVYNFSKGTVDLNNTDGAYWTSDGSKGSSTNANAYGFYFRNTSSATEFCWETDASGVSSKRNTQRSVRLLVEVDKDNGNILEN